MSTTSLHTYVGGCQNYGPFGVPIIIRYLLFRVPKKGTIILTTTHMYMQMGAALELSSRHCVAEAPLRRLPKMDLDSHHARWPVWMAFEKCGAP